MDLFDFCTTFLFDYMSCSTVQYLIFLVQSKSSDVKEWFDKKLNFHADNKFLYFWIDILSKVCIYYLLVSIFRENNWLGKIMLT